mmetsp:Transcript_9728/g.13630  ORF Transcript_9728/g.13630 Transcript_9728/m.13630 type:complete len:110 (+) Transcript_9728:221-550(+)
MVSKGEFAVGRFDFLLRCAGGDAQNFVWAFFIFFLRMCCGHGGRWTVHVLNAKGEVVGCCWMEGSLDFKTQISKFLSFLSIHKETAFGVTAVKTVDLLHSAKADDWERE